MRPVISRLRFAAVVATLGLSVLGCSSITEPPIVLPLVTRVNVTFTPQGGGDPLTAYIDDADGAGPIAASAQVGSLVFLPGETYVGTVTLEHRVPPLAVSINSEIEARGTVYRVYHRVAGLMTGAGFIVTPTDVDARDRPIGLAFTAAVHPTMGGQTGTLIVTLCEYVGVSKSTTSTECVGEALATASFAMSATN